MTIAKNDVAIFLSEEGRKALQVAKLDLPKEGAIAMFVQDTDDLGLWVRAERRDGEHLLLIRWEFVVSIDVLPTEKRPLGIRT